MTTNTIFSKQLKDVTWDNVRDFCEQQHAEGINLDYKQQLTKEVTKTVAAMANTNGGWIIVGVEDKHDKPKLPVIGLEYNPRLESQLTDMILGNLWPYFRPITHLCPPNSDGKTFLLIYVPESMAAPHWVFNRSRLYIRRSDKTSAGKWEEQANADVWEMLRNKRKKSVELRKESVNELEYLYYLHRRDNTASNIASLMTPPVAWERRARSNNLNMYAQPLFPVDKICDVEQAGNLFHECSRTYKGDFYPNANVPIRYYADGAYLYSKLEEMFEEFLGFDSWGTAVAKSHILQISNNGSRDSYIQLYELISKMWKFLTFCTDAYTKLGYVGLVKVRVTLDLPDPDGVVLNLASGTTRLECRNVQGYVSWDGEIEDRQLYDVDARQELMRQILRRIYLSFNAPTIGDEQLTHVLTDTKALAK